MIYLVVRPPREGEANIYSAEREVPLEVLRAKGVDIMGDYVIDHGHYSYVTGKRALLVKNRRN